MADRTRRCFQCSKAILYVINMIFWMLGAALLGLGIWLHLTNDKLVAVSPGYGLMMPAALFIVPGCLSLVVGFLGCCGAITENKCLVIGYCVLVGIIFVLEVSGSVAAFVGEIHFKAHSEIKQQLMLSINETYPGENPSFTYERNVVHGWDMVQKQFECCGVDHYKDWFKSHGWPFQDRVPDSCCRDQYVGCGVQGPPNLWYDVGCSEPIKDFIVTHLFTVAVVTCLLAGFQVVTIVGAVIFLHYHKKHKDILH